MNLADRRVNKIIDGNSTITCLNRQVNCFQNEFLFKRPGLSTIKMFGGGEGGRGHHLQNPLPLRTTFAFTHLLFSDVFGKIP